MQTLTDHAFSLKSAIQLQKTGNPWPVVLTGNVGEGKEELYNTSKPLHIYNASSQQNLWLKLSYTKGVKIKGVEVLYSIKVPNSTVDFVPTGAPLKTSFYCFSLKQCVNNIDVETQTDSKFTYMFDSSVI
uniref:Uncharacterized protein n=1 Tax=Ditylenchus dipsaci TaxID=166011 RepID=A0A915EVR0_9BILA